MVNAIAERSKAPPAQIGASFLPQEVRGTVRYHLKVTAAGSAVRVRLSNEQGKKPLSISVASIGGANAEFAANPGSLQPLTFGGSRSITIPAGAPVLSDPVALPVSFGSKLIISAACASVFSNEPLGSAAFVLAPDDQTTRPTMEHVTKLSGRPLVTAVSVCVHRPTKVIVAFGDSITDGSRGNVDALNGWPDRLSQRLNARKRGNRYTVVNAGIGGNRLLAPGWGPAGLSRLDRDALRIEGVYHLVLLEGINDIGMSGAGVFGDNPPSALQT
jgi:hypothetical protein